MHGPGSGAPDDRERLQVLGSLGLCTVRLGLFPGTDNRATTSTAKQSRSESVVAINPLNESNVVGASKKFIEPSLYHFTLAPIYSFDAGETWHESSLPMEAGWDGMTDPTVAFDHFGHAFLVGEPLTFGQDLTGHGMAVFRSSDGGVTWQPPFRLTTQTNDDKQWVLCDNSSTSPYYGNVYVTWGASSPLRFARSTDHGQTWKGKGQDPPGTTLVSYAFAPDISISEDGTLHIFWHNEGSDAIHYLRSTDGGVTFDPLRIVVQPITSLRSGLPVTGGWPHFDYGKFRVMTIVTSCSGSVKCWNSATMSAKASCKASTSGLVGSRKYSWKPSSRAWVVSCATTSCDRQVKTMPPGSWPLLRSSVAGK